MVAGQALVAGADLSDLLDARTQKLVEARLAELLPGRVVRPGEVAKERVVSGDRLQRIVTAAAVTAAGLDPARTPTSPPPILWEEGGSRLVVNVAKVQVTPQDGVVDITIPVRCDETGDAAVTVTFVTGSADRPTGGLAATEDRPRGPAVVVERWHEALIAFAWHTFVAATAAVSATGGTDPAGRPLITAGITAIARRLVGAPDGPSRVRSLRHQRDQRGALVTALPTLDAEIADLGVAIGLLESGPGGVEVDSAWFNDPAARLAGAIADDDRRAALIRFVDAVIAEGDHTERDGVTFIPIVDVRRLSGNNAAPDVVIEVIIDDRPANHVEIGIAARIATANPATTTDVEIPIYRAAKQGHTVAQPFALLDGGVVRVASELVLDTTPVAHDAFGLAGVAVAIETPLTGGAPTFQLALRGLHLPGADAPTDLHIGAPGVPIVDSLLSLVLALARQGADALTGPAADQVNAVLDLVGLGDAGAIPTLPVEELLAGGATALQAWFASVMSSPAARAAWLNAIGEMLGGTAAPDHVDLPIGGGPVTARGWGSPRPPVRTGTCW